MKRVIIFVVSLFVLVSCSRSIDEELVKGTIKAWWGTEEVDDVIVESFTKLGRSVVFDARLIASGDTLERMTYEFKKGVRGWEITRGPFDDKQKRFLLEYVGFGHIGFFERQREIVEVFKGVMDMFGSYAGGRYPLTLRTAIGDISDYEGEKREETVFDMIRPFLEGELPFVDAKGDTNEWFAEYRRKVVYFPLQKENGYALQYIVKAGMDTCFVDDIMKIWNEQGGGL
jgi:hypothetical protein